MSLALGAGDAVLLTGPSGAGKTTLLKLVFAAELVDQGRLFVADHDVARLSRSSIPFLRRNIGVVFQDFKLLGNRSALENVAVALEVLGLRAPEVRTRSIAALDAVGLAARSDVAAAALSGGEQQRVAVARAIVGNPDILLCDEPTGNLDPERAEQLMALLERIHEYGTTLLVATHDPQVIKQGQAYGWRSAHLIDGELLDEERRRAHLRALDDPEARAARVARDAGAAQKLRTALARSA